MIKLRLEKLSNLCKVTKIRDLEFRLSITLNVTLKSHAQKSPTIKAFVKGK